ncbi:Beta-N-acetylhexosaminidase [Aphelenchoides fujianensis]|nr:Beta-N-acetylhexosaminidase [Aphelenchoides fujianensis]
MTTRVFLLAACFFGFLLFSALSFALQNNELISEMSARTDQAPSKMKARAPPRIEFYEPMFKLLHSLGVDSILMEYEDTFPYSGPLAQLPQADAYTKADIQLLNELSRKYELELVPLVRSATWNSCSNTRASRTSTENPVDFSSICPSDPQSLVLIEELVKQVRELHPEATLQAFTWALTKAYHVNEDQRCHDAVVSKFHNSTDSLKLNHLANIAQIARKHNFTTGLE